MKLQKLFASALLLVSVTIIVKAQAPAKGPAGKTAESELMDLDRQLQEAVVTGKPEVCAPLPQAQRSLAMGVPSDRFGHNSKRMPREEWLKRENKG